MRRRTVSSANSAEPSSASLKEGLLSGERSRGPRASSSSGGAGDEERNGTEEERKRKARRRLFAIDFDQTLIINLGRLDL